MLRRVLSRRRWATVGVACFLGGIVGGSFLWLRYSDGMLNEKAVDPIANDQTHLHIDEASTRAVLRIQHDFGLVRNGAQLSHTFAVKNDSDIPWTVKKIVTSCSCTVPSVSNRTFLPNSVNEVLITYRAPNRTADEGRVVTIEFEEPAAPQLSLAITANVREPLTIGRSEISLVTLPGGPAATCDFAVQNFGDTDWTSVKAVGSDGWLSAAVSAQPQSQRVGRITAQARQSWSVKLTADPTGRPQGEAMTNLAVSAYQGDRLVAETWVSVKLTVARAVTPYPDEMFLGDVRGKPSLERVVMFRLARGNSRPSADSVKVEHDLAADVALAWKEAGNTDWMATVTIKPKDGAQAGLHVGRLRFTFRVGETDQAVEIPVRFRNG